jgi:hypothetical protein
MSSMPMNHSNEAPTAAHQEADLKAEEEQKNINQSALAAMRRSKSRQGYLSSAEFKAEREKFEAETQPKVRLAMRQIREADTQGAQQASSTRFRG